MGVSAARVSPIRGWLRNASSQSRSLELLHSTSAAASSCASSASGLRTAIRRAHSREPQQGRISYSASSVGSRFHRASTSLMAFGQLRPTVREIQRPDYPPPPTDTSPWNEYHQSAKFPPLPFFAPAPGGQSRCAAQSKRVPSRPNEAGSVPRFRLQFARRQSIHFQDAPALRCIPLRSLARFECPPCGIGNIFRILPRNAHPLESTHPAQVPVLMQTCEKFGSAVGVHRAPRQESARRRTRAARAGNRPPETR